MESNLNTAPCCYFSSTDDGILLQVNNTLSQQLGFDQAELTGKKVDQIFTIATRIFYQTHFYPLLKMQGSATEIFISLQTKTKAQLPLLLNAERKEVDGTWVIIYAGMVVHNRKKFEDELVAAKKAAEAALQENTALIRAKEELQQSMEQLDLHLSKISQQNNELKQFNQVLTHDIQEPLRKMFMFTNLLLDGLHKGEDYKTAAEKLLHAATQMRSIISGLQQYVWLTETATQLSEVHINKLVKVVQQQLESEFPDVTLTIDMAPVPPLPADWNQMQLLLYHILSNAIRFRKEGGAAYVEINATTLQKNKFTSLEEKYSYHDYIRIEIKDNGIGFKPEYSTQVFQLFKRLHAASGRGVGLALSKKVVDNHFGEITIDSREGEGTVVKIWLPFSTKPNGEGHK